MSWHPPQEAEILQVVDATWPAARYVENGPFTLRLGQGGGQRVSAASANGPARAAEISAAESAMRAMGQKQLFMIAGKDKALDDRLAALGYRVKDPVSMFAAPAKMLAMHEQKGLVASRAVAPLAVMKTLWGQGGIGPGRLAVMARARGAKTYLLGRVGESPAGVAYVAMHGQTAMLHALEVAPAARRKGLGQALSAAAAAWAVEQGAETFSLIAVTANAAACGLYRHLGMVKVGNYHYRIKD